MRRTWLVLLALVVVIALGVGVVVAVVKANDDDNGNPSATSWANSVCSSIDEWRSSITGLADVSGGSLSKDTLREKLDDANSATQQLVDELRDLGTPDLEAGDQLKQELDTDADNLQSSYDDLSSKAQEALDATTATGFLNALAALATPFQNLVSQISTTIQDLQNANVGEDAKTELKQAFDDADACQKLRSEQD